MRYGKVKARPLYPIMPWLWYGRMTDNDLRDVFAYLRAQESPSNIGWTTRSRQSSANYARKNTVAAAGTDSALPDIVWKKAARS